MKKNFKIGLAALALVVTPIAIGVVSAQTVPAATVTAKTNYASVFMTKLASTLGVTTEKLTTAFKTANEATIAQALQNQDMTKDQANRLRQDAQNGHYAFFGRENGQHMGGGRDGGGRDGGQGERGMMGGRGMGGPGMPGREVMFDAAAKALGLTSAELQTQLQSGQTLEQIAKTKNVDLQVVKDVTLAVLKTQLAADVKAGTITQVQADQMLARAKANPNVGMFGFKGAPRR